MRNRLKLVIAIGAAMVASIILGPPTRAGQSAKDSGQFFLRVEAGGHTSEVRKVIYAGGDQKLISVGRDKAVRIWDIASGKEEQTLRAWIGPDFTGEIYAAALSPNGKLLAIAGQDYSRSRARGTLLPSPGGTGSGCEIRLFDLDSKKIVGVLKGHEDSVSSLTFYGNDMLASGGVDRTVWLWNVSSRQGRKTVLPNRVNGVAVSPDGKLVAAACDDSKVRVLNEQTRKIERTLDIGAPAYCIDWSSDGSLLAAGSEDHKVHLWDARTFDSKGMLEQPDVVTCLAFDRTGNQLLTGSGETEALNDRVVRLWSVPERKVIQTFSDDRGMATISSVAFSADGASAVSADLAGVVSVWNLQIGRRAVKRLKSTGAGVFSVAWAPDGAGIAWGNTPPDGGKAPLEHGFNLDTGAPASVAPGVNWIMARRSEGDRTLDIDRSNSRNNQVIVRENGRVIGNIKVRDPRDPKDLFDTIYQATFVNPDQVIIGTQFRLVLYSVAGKPIKEFVGHEGAVHSVAISPDGKRLLSGSADQTVRVWDDNAPGKKKFGEDNAVEPLMSLFRGNDGEWVTWTPEGYYSASLNGDDIIGWQQNGKHDEEAVFYSARQLHSRFYRPDTLAKLRTAGSTLAALEATNKAELARAEQDRQRALDEVKRLKELAARVPPESAAIYNTDLIPKAQAEADAEIQRVKTLTPEAQKAIVHQAPDQIRLIPELEVVGVEPAVRVDATHFTTDKSEIVINVRVKNVKPEMVTLMAQVDARVAQGERRLGEEAAPPPQPGVKPIHVHLSHGTDNTIRISGSTGLEGGQSFEVELHVRCDAPVTVNDGRKLWLLSVGVNKYAQRGFSELTYAKRDATEMAKFFLDQKGKLFDAVEAVTLVEEQATRGNIESKIDEIVAKSRVQDYIVLFFACHGTDGNVLGISRFCMAVSNSHTDDLESMIDGERIITKLKLAKCTVVLLLDTCQSGTIADSFTRLLHESPLNIFSACKPDESSYEHYDWDQHGAFTHGILEGLHKDSLYRNGTLTFGSLANYVTESVFGWVPEKFPGKTQTPQLPSNARTNVFPIAKRTK